MYIKYINDIEAAAYLSLSVHTLRVYRQNKKGPEFYKLGRSVKYTKETLDAWAKVRLTSHLTSM